MSLRMFIGQNKSEIISVIISTSDPLEYCGEDTVNTELISSNSYSSYQWYRNSILIEGATAATYTATEAGEYYLKVTSQYNCEGVSNTIEIIITVL